MQDNRSSDYSREMKAKVLLVLFDLFGILLSLNIGFLLAMLFNYILGLPLPAFSTALNELLAVYIIVVFLFFYEGLYTYRFDFWHESKLIMKGLFLSLIITLAYLALIQDIENYSRSIIISSFVAMALIIPIVKKLVKRKLFDIGLWKLGVEVNSKNDNLVDEIFNNPYLGYIKSKRKESSITFLDSQNNDTQYMKKELEKHIRSKEKVMFVPVFNNYQFSSSEIFELNNSRTSLIVLQNKLNSKYRMFINIVYNYILAVVLLPLLLPIIGIISLLVKRDSKGPIFFMQERLGLDGKVFLVYKFRTMHVNGDEILKKYLQEHPEEVENYEIYCKYENDPRITKVGKILRNTSADELAQIFNVLKGEMNFVGPRPYMLTEKEKIGDTNTDVILKVKPGITGLWQVSGRNELTFEDRIDMDKWYIYNWSLWMDFVIFVKTISVVLNRSGAK